MTTDLSALLESLKQDYLVALPQKISKIDTLMKEQRLDAIRDEFHKLKGTGKTYGFAEISELSEAVEKLCDARTKDLSWIIPSALHVLQKIYEIHHSHGETRVDQDAEFIKIRSRSAEL